MTKVVFTITTVPYFLMRPPSVRAEGVIDQMSCSIKKLQTVGSLYGGLKLPTYKTNKEINYSIKKLIIK